MEKAALEVYFNQAVTPPLESHSTGPTFLCGYERDQPKAGRPGNLLRIGDGQGLCLSGMAGDNHLPNFFRDAVHFYDMHQQLSSVVPQPVLKAASSMF